MNGNLNSHSPEVVFLVGAGISIPIDIPAMGGMYKAFINRNNTETTSSQRSTCTFFNSRLGVPEDLEEFLVSANSIVDFKDSSLARLVEKALSTRRNTKNLTAYQLRLKNLIQDVIDVRRGILDFMSKTCFRFNRDKAREIFSDFLIAISN